MCNLIVEMSLLGMNRHAHTDTHSISTGIVIVRSCQSANCFNFVRKSSASFLLVFFFSFFFAGIAIVRQLQAHKLLYNVRGLVWAFRFFSIFLICALARYEYDFHCAKVDVACTHHHSYAELSPSDICLHIPLFVLLFV